MLVLLFDLLLGHLHIIGELYLLIGEVGKCYQHIEHRDAYPQIRHRVRHQLQRLHQSHVIEIEQYDPFILQIGIADISDQSNLGHGLHKLHQSVDGKNLLEAADWIQLVELWLHGL